MSNHTRGPQKGRVPPHIQDRVQEKRERRARRLAMGPWYRRPWTIAASAAVLALIAGIVVGRVTAPDPVAAAVEEAESVIAIADQSEVIWQGGTAQGAPPVSTGVEELRAGSADVVGRNLDLWLATYDRVIGQLETAPAPPAADGVRRLAIVSAQLSKDAVETLGAAATADGATRELLLDEVERIRARAEQYDASARRLLAQLKGDDEADVPQPAATMPSLPRPSAPAAGSPPPTEEASPATSPTSADTDATSSPEPSPDGS